MTPTLKLNAIALTNFGPFVGTHKLELPSHGLHMVLGENQDTDESSGAGKSSLVESLAYAFDYSNFSATDLKSWDWLTKEPMAVDVDFEAKGVTTMFRRGAKAYVKTADRDRVTSAKECKAALDRIIGLRPEMLKALTYRPQGQPGLFLAMTDSEKKSFMTELLGLGAYEDECERITKTINELEQREVTLKAVAESAKAQVPPEPAPLPSFDISDLGRQRDELNENIRAGLESLENLRTADKNYQDALSQRVREVTAQWSPHVENLQLAYAEAQSRPFLVPPKEVPELPPELDGLKRRLALLRQAIAKAKDDHTQKLRQVRNDAQDDRNEMHALRSHANSQARVATAELERLEGEVAILREQMCAMCKRPWTERDATLTLQSKLDRIDELKDQLKEVEDELRQAAEAEARMVANVAKMKDLEALDPVPAKLADGEHEYTQKVADVEAAYRTAVAEVDRRHKDAIKLANAQHAQLVAEAESKLAKAEGDMLQAVNKAQEMTPEHVLCRETMGRVKATLDQANADRRVIIERIEAAQRRQRDLAAAREREQAAWQTAYDRYRKAVLDHEDITTTLDRERDYLGCVRSFLGVIFDETLNRIAYLTNERLARVPNVQGLTLRFVSERETKTTKNLRQEIKAIIEKDGHEIPLKRISGGMNRAVELAVDLSLADVIAERTGVMPGWLVLDEAFDGLSMKSKSACLELLKDAAETRLILVIEHTTEFKELFSSTITVRSRDGVSFFG